MDSPKRSSVFIIKVISDRLEDKNHPCGILSEVVAFLFMYELCYTTICWLKTAMYMTP